MKSPRLSTLLFCAGLLPALPAVAAEKRAPRAQSSYTGPQPSPKSGPQGRRVALLRRAPPKPSPRNDVGARRAADDTAASTPPAAAATVETHRVKRGETLGQIASRYATAEAALRALNGFESDDTIRAGQILFVPSQTKPAPARSAAKSPVWLRYAKPPKEKGAVELSTHSARFVGSVVDKQGRLRPVAVRALNDLLGAGGKHPPLPERMIRLLVKVSDAFGGRPIHAVSGYRANSYFQDSRHRLSAAVDFAIAEVPNTVLCAYLRELEDVGVGYYPNSSFVHMDVRTESAYWVDYAGPGEPPRATPYAPRPARGSKQWLMAELDAMVHQTTKDLERASADAARAAPKPQVPALESPPGDTDAPGSSAPVAL